MCPSKEGTIQLAQWIRVVCNKNTAAFSVLRKGQDTRTRGRSEAHVVESQHVRLSISYARAGSSERGESNKHARRVNSSKHVSRSTRRRLTRAARTAVVSDGLMSSSRCRAQESCRGNSARRLEIRCWPKLGGGPCGGLIGWKCERISSRRYKLAGSSL